MNEKLKLRNESFIFYHGITWRFKEPVPAPEVLSIIPEEADTLRLLIESEHESLFINNCNSRLKCISIDFCARILL